MNKDIEFIEMQKHKESRENPKLRKLLLSVWFVGSLFGMGLIVLIFSLREEDYFLTFLCALLMFVTIPIKRFKK